MSVGQLASFQKNKCIKIIDKLIEWPICFPFVNPVDPDKDKAVGYFEKIKNPMSLSEVKKHLYSNDYKDLNEFIEDVNLIWSNCENFNGPDALLTHMAHEAKLYFDKKMENFPKSNEDEWTKKIQSTAKKLLDVLSHPPAELSTTGKSDRTDD